MELEVGLQLYTVRNTLRDNLEAGLKIFSDIGYKNVEFAAFDPEELAGEKPLDKPSAKDLKVMMNKLGMNMLTTTVPTPSKVDELLKADINWELAIDYCAEMGCKGIVIAMMMYESKEQVLQFAQYCNEIAMKCKKRQLKLYYHNHFQEFQTFDGEYALDIFLQHTDPDWVKLEIDTYWVLRGGVDPVSYLTKVGNRCELIHQKDLAKECENIDLVKGRTELITQEDFSTINPDDFIEVGKGCMDIEAIVKTAKEMGCVSHIIIEQDYTKLSPVESAGISLAYMNSIL